LLLKRTGPGSPYPDPAFCQLCNRSQSGQINLYQRLTRTRHRLRRSWGVPGKMESREARIERYRQEAANLRAEAEIFYDPAARQQLSDVAHQYEILVTSLEMLPPEQP
jgi:hypothetical protein